MPDGFAKSIATLFIILLIIPANNNIVNCALYLPIDRSIANLFLSHPHLFSRNLLTSTTVILLIFPFKLSQGKQLFVCILYDFVGHSLPAPDWTPVDTFTPGKITPAKYGIISYDAAMVHRDWSVGCWVMVGCRCCWYWSFRLWSKIVSPGGVTGYCHSQEVRIW